jgi:hypothetical protein
VLVILNQNAATLSKHLTHPQQPVGWLHRLNLSARTAVLGGKLLHLQRKLRYLVFKRFISHKSRAARPPADSK